MSAAQSPANDNRPPPPPGFVPIIGTVGEGGLVTFTPAAASVVVAPPGAGQQGPRP